MNILIIDGQGGKIGAALAKAVLAELPGEELMCVGTNSTAASAMLKAGAPRAATGENPVSVACRHADFIIGPVGIAVADSLDGEITPSMALAVAQSDAVRILIPVNKCSIIVAGVAPSSLGDLISDAVKKLKEFIRA